MRRVLRKFYFKFCLKYKYTPIARLGSEYGGWNVPKGAIDNSSVCYLAGAGLDISFDLDMAAQYKCQVHIFDPTPRAAAHFKELEEHVATNRMMRYKEGMYSVNNEDFKLINYHTLGVWNKDEVVRFYVPKNPEHVSHSLVNLQQTSEYFEAEVVTLKTAMTRLNHPKIDLLKLDIEGAEYQVLESLVADKLDVKVLCVEFDEVHTPIDLGFIARIHRSIKMLKEYGYQIAAIDSTFNITFVKK